MWNIELKPKMLPYSKHIDYYGGIIILIFWIILFSILGSVGAIISATAFLLLGEKIQKILIPCLIAFATGTLLAAALLGLIPNALAGNSSISILSTVLVGIVIFFLLEKTMIWRHCHDINCEKHSLAGPMLLIGDALHNGTDGLVIAASFLSAFPLGIATSISIIAHEIPQEVGDFAILLHGGYPKKRAFLLNLASSLSTLPAAILAYFALDIMRQTIPHVMAFSAASFLYIALTDLYPQLHKVIEFRHSLRQFFFMLSGILIMIFLLHIQQF